MPDRNNEKNKKKDSNADLSYAVSFLAQLGFTIAGCIIIGVLFGVWLDGFFNTQPWLTLVGSLLGLAAAFMSIIRIAQRK
jgi:F0F1-type ATP synthase assembly protein I